ncbi:ABC transporter permease [Candidatus Eisenbacteria bacterium]|uniref:ABC transporter permease n=1 Tax=Eiseniibacteriota bacterium TaxID=2212470 RepID=A0ABV6YKM8_UNCEI
MTRTKTRRLRGTLILVPVGFLMGLLVWPIFEVILASLEDSAFSLDEAVRHYWTHPLYRTVVLNTLKIGLLTTTVTLFFAYPLAFLLVESSRYRRLLLVWIVLASMWLSVQIRSYSWIVLLQRTGPISKLLRAVGIVDADTSFLFSTEAVTVGMVHVLLPFAIMVIWSVSARNATKAKGLAMSLGANDFFYLLRVYAPSVTGAVLAAGLLVFLMSIGFYITPELLGGGRGDTMMMATLIDQQVNQLGDWGSGASLALILAVAVVTILVLGTWVLRKLGVVANAAKHIGD